MNVVIIPHLHDPDGRLADAEIHFADGPLAGMKLIGFTVWRDRNRAQNSVTFPARQQPINGVRKLSDLFVPISEPRARDAVRDLILAEYHRVITTWP